MKLCLSCRRLWPREALLCGYCGCSFGGRLCSRRHISPASARCCIICGQTELTPPTGYLPLGWLIALLTWGGLMLAGLWFWQSVRHPLMNGLEQIAVMVAAVGIVLALVPGPLGRGMRMSVSRLLRGVWRLLLFGAGYRLLRVTSRWLHGLVDGSARRRYR